MKFFNTPSRKIEGFSALDKNEVKLYTCGPTVYDYQHIGNYSGYIYWDILMRILVENGFGVKRIMNITDVGHLVSDADEGEDKLEKGARREGKSAWEVAQFYMDDFIRNMETLNLIAPDKHARATDYIDDQIALIKKVEEKGYTYVISDGVYYDTSKFPRYADFAHLDLAGQEEGARVATNPEKKNPWDFALWKFSPKDKQRDMEWESPWGKGFPGWHIECSAIAMKLLGETLDIHTGGVDHIPVHHTNEVAQSEAATGKTFSRFWLHNNHLMSEGTKISKSLGNGYTLQDLEKKGFSPLDFKLFVLQTHFRNSGNFTWENLQAAKNRLSNYRAMADLRWQPVEGGSLDADELEMTEKIIKSALEEDLDTPAALAALSSLEEVARIKLVPPNLVPKFKDFVKKIDDLLGLQLADSSDITQEQRETIQKRENARSEQDWTAADKFRDELAEHGVLLNDTKYGPIWQRL
jgi:cysteinyl-tRNA synthetase